MISRACNVSVTPITINTNARAPTYQSISLPKGHLAQSRADAPTDIINQDDEEPDAGALRKTSARYPPTLRRCGRELCSGSESLPLDSRRKRLPGAKNGLMALTRNCEPQRLTPSAECFRGHLRHLFRIARRPDRRFRASVMDKSTAPTPTTAVMPSKPLVPARLSMIIPSKIPQINPAKARARVTWQFLRR
jgi:hypothetical protein